MMVWVGGQQGDTPVCLLTAEPQSFGVFGRAHLQIELLLHLRSIVRHSWDEAGGACSTLACMYLLHPNWQPVFGRAAKPDRAFPH